MTTMEERAGAGPFEWNAGGWFGSLFGGTLWLFLGAGVLSAAGHAVAALVWTLCTAAGVGVGVALWKRRERIAPHRGIQTLIWSLFVLGVIAMVAVDVTNANEALADHTIARGALKYAALLVFPILSAVFALRERASK